MFIFHLSQFSLRHKKENAVIQISVIIVSYKARDLTIRCVSSILAQLKGLDAEVIVVDNNSQDGTIAYLQQASPAVKTISLPENVGFGAACNIGFDISLGQRILFLNPDAYLERNSIDVMMENASANENVGIYGPKIVGEDGQVTPSCFRFKRIFRDACTQFGLAWTGINKYSQSKLVKSTIVDWLTGCCMLVDRNAFVQVGGFDEKFFLYSEETDLSFRMMKLGWVSMYVPAAMCQHIGGGSTKFGNDIRHGYMMRSELYFFRKSFGKRSYYAAIIFRFLSGFLKLIPFALLNMVSCGKIYFFSYRVARSLADIKYSILTIDDPRGVNIPPKPGSLLVGTNACRPSKTMVSK